jgi:hypothetical protein
MNESAPARHPLAITSLGAMLFLYLRSFSLPGTPLAAHDDRMVFFARAVRMTHGQMPYRDFFEMVTPGTDLLYEATFRLLGVHAWIPQVWSIAVGVALCLLLTRIASRILTGWTVLLPSLLFLVFAFDSAPEPTHHWFSTLAALAAVSVLLEGRELARIAAASLLCAVATLFTQTHGGLAFLAIALFLAWRRPKNETPSLAAQLATFILPYLLLVGAVLGYYVHQAGWHSMLFDLVEFPVKYLQSPDDMTMLRGYLAHLPTVHNVPDLLHFVPYLLVHAAVPYACLYALYRAARNPGPQQNALILLSLTGLALFLAVAHEPRFHRICTVAPPAMLAAVWLASGPGVVSLRIRRVLWGLGLGFLVLMPVSRQVKRLPTLDLPTGRLAFADPQEYREVQWLAARTHPGDLFFNADGIGLYLALDNPTPSEWVADTEFSRPEQVTATVAALQAHKPRFIAMPQTNTSPTDPHNHDQPFRQFVHQNYRLAATFSISHGLWSEEIWEPKD